MEYGHTKEDLERLRSKSLFDKEGISIARIMEWYRQNDNKTYISLSGGKDSTVLAYLSAIACSLMGTKLTLWFSDTGLEFPEIKEHVKTFTEYLKQKFPTVEVELVIDYPRDRKGNRITFRHVIEKYGYPVVSKEQAQYIYEYRHTDSKIMKDMRLNGNKWGRGKISEKWRFLIDAPFEVTHKCCLIMKKSPAKKFEHRTGLKPIIGTMTEESKNRTSAWLRHGCNAFDATRPTSQPMSFWTEQDVLEYIVKYDIPIASVYGEIKKTDCGKYYLTGEPRTGCMFCMFGLQFEKDPNKFQRLKKTHPKIWEFCMKPWNEGGLGMKEVMEYMHFKIE